LTVINTITADMAIAFLPASAALELAMLRTGKIQGWAAGFVK
jgi:hypothetical protein